MYLVVQKNTGSVRFMSKTEPKSVDKSKLTVVNYEPSPEEQGKMRLNYSMVYKNGTLTLTKNGLQVQEESRKLKETKRTDLSRSLKKLQEKPLIDSDLKEFLNGVLTYINND